MLAFPVQRCDTTFVAPKSGFARAYVLDRLTPCLNIVFSLELIEADAAPALHEADSIICHIPLPTRGTLERKGDRGEKNYTS